MTEALKALLQHFGTLAVTLSHLMSQRLGTEHENLEAYYESFGNPLPDEPVLVVRISEDGGTRFLKEGDHDVVLGEDSGQNAGKLTVWELPEDEFWFFHAFRPGLFDLEKELPPFVYAMGIVDSFATFEGYLTNLLKLHIRKYPKLLGGQRQLGYEKILEAKSKDDIVEFMIEREIGELTYLSLSDLLTRMRVKLGFRNLTSDYDEEVCELALVRNCLLHNYGKVDGKLSVRSRTYQVGDAILCDLEAINRAINNLRKLAYEIDNVFLEKV